MGEKHKYKGLVMLHNTWPAAELSSLLDNAAQYKQEWEASVGGAPWGLYFFRAVGGGCCDFYITLLAAGNMEKIRPSFISLFSLHNGFQWEGLVSFWGSSGPSFCRRWHVASAAAHGFTHWVHNSSVCSRNLLANESRDLGVQSGGGVIALFSRVRK